jgi:DNA ligase D-like protein (predicted 3'-phosphoesterase)
VLLDYGHAALVDTLDQLRAAGIAYVGAGADVHEAGAPCSLTVRHHRVAILAPTDHPGDFGASVRRPGVAYAELRNGLPAWLTHALEASAAADVRLCVVHWGPNMTTAPVTHVRRAAGEFRRDGAMLVAGSSAHVPDGAADGVLYDLGDFLDDYASTPSCAMTSGCPLSSRWATTQRGTATRSHWRSSSATRASETGATHGWSATASPAHAPNSAATRRSSTGGRASGSTERAVGDRLRAGRQGGARVPRRDALRQYRAKRDLKRSPEHSGARRARRGGPRFVVQKHAATSLHYDFRLEVGDVLKSWAVPKGPSTDPREKRLAMTVADHPLDYAEFEGVIPEGEYGAGAVIVWDTGPYRNMTERDGEEVPLEEALADGHAVVELEGEKLRGGYALQRVGGGRRERWLLIKRRDEGADARRNPVSTQPESVISGRTVEQVAEQQT